MQLSYSAGRVLLVYINHTTCSWYWVIEIQNKYLIWQNMIEIAIFCLDCVSLLFDSPMLFMNQHLLDYVNLHLPQWHSTPDGAMFIIPNRLQTYGYSTAWPQFQRQDGVFSEMSLLLITIIGNSKCLHPDLSIMYITSDNSSARTYHKDNDMVSNSFIYMMHMNSWWHGGYPYHE